IGEKIIGASDSISQPVVPHAHKDYVQSIGTQDLRKMCFAILGKSESYTSTFSNAMANESLRNLLEDIEFWDVSFPKLNRTQTVFGEAVLARMIATPTFDADVLRKRQ